MGSRLPGIAVQQIMFKSLYFNLWEEGSEPLCWQTENVEIAKIGEMIHSFDGRGRLSPEDTIIRRFIRMIR